MEGLAAGPYAGWYARRHLVTWSQVWPGRVNAVVPKHGLHVWWDGLWMEKAEGVSLNQLSYKRQRNFVAESLTVSARGFKQ